MAAREQLLSRHGRQIDVYRLPFHSQAVAEMAISLLLASFKQLVAADRDMRRGVPMTSKSALLFAGKVVLVLGLGEVGERVASCCHALGMSVSGIRRTPEKGAPPFVRLHRTEEFEDQLRVSDALVVCLPLTGDTHHLIAQARARSFPRDRFW